jgi:hypothetical protein
MQLLGSLLAHNFASLYLGHKPKAKVTTERVTLGEATYNEANTEAINLENYIVTIGLEFSNLDKEQNGIAK